MVAVDHPIRWRLFNLNKKNRKAFEDMNNCPCGTQGSCMVCVGPNEYLYERWMWTVHPLRSLWLKIRGGNA